MEEFRLQEELKKTRQELLLLYEIGNLIRTTLHLDEVIYLILSAVTSHEGMGFNRALLFLVDDTGTYLECKMGIGPLRLEAGPVVWKSIREKQITLEGLLDVYHKSGKKIDPDLNTLVTAIKFPIEKDFGAIPQAVIHESASIISKEDANHALADMNLRNLIQGQFAVVPLKGKDQIVGVLVVDNVINREEITENDIRRLTMLANHAGLAVENAKTYHAMVVNAQQDSLTKLWNHGHFQKLLSESLSKAKHEKSELSLIVFDVDNFKAYNDHFGHQAGDKALEFIARVSKNVMRKIDYLARYGGEEFAAVLPQTSNEEALMLAERLRSAIEKETTNAWQTIVPKKITVSVGVATYPHDADEKEKLIYCADGALYESKRAGKNRVSPFKR